MLQLGTPNDYVITQSYSTESVGCSSVQGNSSLSAQREAYGLDHSVSTTRKMIFLGERWDEQKSRWGLASGCYLHPFHSVKINWALRAGRRFRPPALIHLQQAR